MLGSMSEEGKEGPTLLVAQGLHRTHASPSVQGGPTVACGHAAHHSTCGLPPLSRSPSAPPPPHPGGWHCPCSPDEDTEAPGEGRAEPHWPGHSVLCSDGGTAASPFPRPCPCAMREPLSLHSSQVISQEYSLPPAWPRRAWRLRVGGTLWGCRGGPRAQGAVPVWLEQGVSWSPGPAGGTGGVRWAMPGRVALSCCDRPAGAGQFPDGTAGRSVAAGSTAGSSRRGHS